MNDNNNAGDFPSIDLAYPIAVAAYDVALRRLDTMDGRLQTAMAFNVSVFGAFVTYAGSTGISFASLSFIVAAILCLGNVVLGTWGRFHGKVRLLRPTTLYNEWLSDSEFKFKVDMVYHSGIAFDGNMHLSDRKWKISMAMMFSFFLQVSALVLWVVVCRP